MDTGSEKSSNTDANYSYQPKRAKYNDNLNKTTKNYTYNKFNSLLKDFSPEKIIIDKHNNINKQVYSASKNISSKNISIKDKLFFKNSLGNNI